MSAYQERSTGEHVEAARLTEEQVTRSLDGRAVPGEVGEWLVVFPPHLKVYTDADFQAAFAPAGLTPDPSGVVPPEAQLPTPGQGAGPPPPPPAPPPSPGPREALSEPEALDATPGKAEAGRIPASAPLAPSSSTPEAPGAEGAEGAQEPTASPSSSASTGGAPPAQETSLLAGDASTGGFLEA